MSSLLNRLYATDSKGFSAASFSNIPWQAVVGLTSIKLLTYFCLMKLDTIFHMIRCEMILSVVKLHSESINSLCSDVAWG